MLHFERCAAERRVASKISHFLHPPLGKIRERWARCLEWKKIRFGSHGSIKKLCSKTSTYMYVGHCCCLHDKLIAKVHIVYLTHIRVVHGLGQPTGWVGLGRGSETFPKILKLGRTTPCPEKRCHFLFCHNFAKS